MGPTRVTCLLWAGLMLLGSVPSTSAADQMMPTTLIERNDTWAYLDDNKWPGDDWHAPDYNDQSWKRGRSYFATPESVGSDGVMTPLSKGEHAYPAYYFRREFFLPNRNSIKSLSYWIDYDDVYIIYLNGRPIASSDYNCSWNDHDADCGPPIHNSQVDIKVNDRNQPMGGSLGDDTLALLRSGRNVIAVSVKQSMSTSSDGAFAMGLYGQSAEDRPVKAEEEPSKAEDWPLIPVLTAAGLVIAGAMAAVLYRRSHMSDSCYESAIRQEMELLNNELAKSREKFHHREIDEDSMREISREYQKRLINLEVKLEGLKGKGDKGVSVNGD